MARKGAHELVSHLPSAVLIVIAVAAFTTTTTCSAARSVDGLLELPLSSEGMGSSTKGRRSSSAGSGLEYCYNCVCYPWKPYDCECRDLERNVCNPGCDYCDCDEVDQLCQCRDKFKSCPPQPPNPLFSSDQARMN